MLKLDALVAEESEEAELGDSCQKGMPARKKSAIRHARDDMHFAVCNDAVLHPRRRLVKW